MNSTTPITNAVSASTHDLLTAFLETEYRILTDPAIALRIGDVQPQLDRFSGPAGWAIVTADNPHAMLQSERENHIARATLESRLQTIQTGASVKTMHRAAISQSASGWPDEHGWLFGFSRPANVHALACEFSQAGVVTGAVGQPATLWLYRGDWANALPDHVRRISV